jgi:hypothetical protein
MKVVVVVVVVAMVKNRGYWQGVRGWTLAASSDSI